MPLEHILRAIQAQADREIERITRAAETEADQLLAEAESQAQAIRARHRARVEPAVRTQVASLLNKAKLDALRVTANAREQLITDAFAQAQERLAQIRESPEYADIFCALAREAVEALAGDPSSSDDRSGQCITVRVDPRDAVLARQAFADIGMHAEIQTQPIPLGGLEVMTRDERIVIVNTLAVRLERARKMLRGTVAAIVVGQLEPDKEWKTSTAMPTPG